MQNAKQSNMWKTGGLKDKKFSNRQQKWIQLWIKILGF